MDIGLVISIGYDRRGRGYAKKLTIGSTCQESISWSSNNQIGGV